MFVLPRVEENVLISFFSFVDTLFVFLGNHAIMRLTKLFIEAGAAGIHMEDQNQSTKKCGHMGGMKFTFDRLLTEERCGKKMSTYQDKFGY